MPSSIGVNLRVTGHCAKGDRKYMEDYFSVAYQQSEDEKDLEYAFFGIYDGHGGQDAAVFAKEHLMNSIVSQKLFWSDNDDDVLKSIHEGYLATHLAMWRIQDKWPKTSSGLPSTAGTTASVAFIRHGKIYIGHVGDSGIILGYQQHENDKYWVAEPLTQDHKPECKREQARINNSGGKVIVKSGVPRVVWNRPRIGHKGPVRRSTPIDEIPFLAVARSLGDLWSYNSTLNEFVVSPEPDVRVIKIDAKKFRCLIFGTDGLWNVLMPSSAVDIVRQAETVNDSNAYVGGSKEWKNPSKCLVDRALLLWSNTRMRADNTSVVTIMLDPAGPPKKDILKHATSNQSTNPNSYVIDYAPYIQQTEDQSATLLDHRTHEAIALENMDVPASGLAVMTRYDTLTAATTSLGGGYQRMETETETTASTSSGSSSSSSDILYMDSFAESYNSLLTSSLNDHSYTPEFAQQIGDHQRKEETYSLTNLQTKYERMQAAAAALPSYYQPSPSEPSTSTASTSAAATAALARPSSPFSATFHDYHLNYSSVPQTPVAPNAADDDQPNPQLHQMERYNYLQTTTNVYHNINNSNPLIELHPEPAALALIHPTVAMDTDDDDVDVEPEEVADDQAEEETMNVSDDKINNNKNDDSPIDESIQIHEISSSNLNLVAAIAPAVALNDNDISTSTVLKSGNKENVVKKHLRSSTVANKSPSQSQSLFVEKKDTRSSAFRLRNGKKLSDMVDSTKKIKRQVRSLFRETSAQSSKHQKFKDINNQHKVNSNVAGTSKSSTTTIKEKVQNFTNKTLNLVQNVMKENTLNLRSTRNQPKQQPPPKSAAKTSKKEFRKSIGEKLSNLSMRSMSAMKRTTHKSAAITRIMSTRKSSAKLPASSIPFMLSPTVLSPVVTIRRLRKDDMNFALQEYNNNGLGNRGKGRRTTMGLTSTPAIAKKNVAHPATNKDILKQPSTPIVLITRTPTAVLSPLTTISRGQSKRLSARNNPFCPSSPPITKSTNIKTTTITTSPAIQSNNKKVQKRFSK